MSGHARVRKQGFDWLSECQRHDSITWCSDWSLALEAAYGHVAMYHGRNIDTSHTKEDGSR